MNWRVSGVFKSCDTTIACSCMAEETAVNPIWTHPGGWGFVGGAVGGAVLGGGAVAVSPVGGAGGRRLSSLRGGGGVVASAGRAVIGTEAGI